VPAEHHWRFSLARTRFSLLQVTEFRDGAYLFALGNCFSRRQTMPHLALHTYHTNAKAIRLILSVHNDSVHTSAKEKMTVVRYSPRLVPFFSAKLDLGRRIQADRKRCITQYMSCKDPSTTLTGCHVSDQEKCWMIDVWRLWRWRRVLTSKSLEDWAIHSDNHSLAHATDCGS
jgi:hypothetical protein